MNRTIAALFDLDGVIVDTESQYSIYWNNVGVKYLSDPCLLYTSDAADE